MKKKLLLHIFIILFLGIISQKTKAQCGSINVRLDLISANISGGDQFAGPDPTIGVGIRGGGALAGSSLPDNNFNAVADAEDGPITNLYVADQDYLNVAAPLPANIPVEIWAWEDDGCGANLSYNCGFSCFGLSDDDFIEINSTNLALPSVAANVCCYGTTPAPVTVDRTVTITTNNDGNCTTGNGSGETWTFVFRITVAHLPATPVGNDVAVLGCSATAAMPTLSVNQMPGYTFEWQGASAGSTPGIEAGTYNEFYTPSPTEVDLDVPGVYPITVRAINDCTGEIGPVETINVTVFPPCPELLEATASSDVCDGDDVNLDITIAPTPCGYTFVEGVDYYVVWFMDGVEILDGKGADNIWGTADDQTDLTNTIYTVNYAGAADCGSEQRVFTGEIRCLQSSDPLILGNLNDQCNTIVQTYGGAGSSTSNGYTNGCPGEAGSQGPAGGSNPMSNYFNPCTGLFNTAAFGDPIAQFILPLTFLPSCAEVTSVTYQLQGTSDPSCGSYSSSWASEANFVFYTPSANPNSSNPAGTFSWSNAGYTNCGTPDCNQSGGNFNFANSTTSLAGTPASGNWTILFFDDFNDGASNPDGHVSYVYLEVQYEIPCAPNTVGDTQPVTIWDIPDLGTDFVVPEDNCDIVTLVCDAATLTYANALAGPYNLASPTLPLTNGQVIYYQVKTNGSPTGCHYRGSYTVATPTQPSSVVNSTICEGGTLTPAQHLQAICADCPAAPVGDPITVTKNYTGPTVTIDAQTDAPAGSVTFTTADFPTGYVIQDINITVNWQKTDGTCAAPGAGTPYYNEMGLGIATPASTLTLFAPGFYTATGAGPTSATTWTFDQSAAGPPPNTLPPANGATYQPASGTLDDLNGTAALGTYSMTGTDLAGADPLCIASWSVTVVAVPPVAPPVPADVTWYDAQTGGNLQGAGSPLDPTGLFSQQGLFDINTPGNYTFWAQCGCGACVGPRRAVTIQVVPRADGPLLVDQEICLGSSIADIVPIGTAIGSSFNLYTLGSITPENATPQTLFTQADLIGYTPAFDPNTVGSTTYLITEVSTVAGVTCESNPAPITITVLDLPTPTASNSGPYCEGGTIEVSATGGAFYSWSGPGGYSAAGSPGFRFNATLAMAGTYTVTVTSLDGCTATASTVVVVNPNPAAPTATGDDMCIGATVPTLNASIGAATCPTAVACTDPCAACAVGQPLGAPQTTPPSTSGPVSYEGDGTGACSFDGLFATNPPLNINHNPTIPACAQNISYTVSISGVTANGSYPGELNVQYSGPGGASGTIRPSTSCSSNQAFGPVTITSGAASGAGTWTFGLSDGYADSGVDGNVTITITTSYQVPTLPPPPPPSTPTITWWNSPVGGTQQAIGTTFIPTSGTSGSLQGVFDATIPGTYTFFAQSECGACVSVRTPVSLIVNPNPAPTASNNGPICNGASATLTATGGVSYTWDNSAGTGSPVTVSPTSTTTYTVTVTDGNGCTNTASTTVVVNPNPVVTIGAPTYTVCEGGNVVIDGNVTTTTATPYTHIWGGTGAPYLVNANLSDPVFDATLAAPGTYTLTYQIQDNNGCLSNIATTSVTISTGATPAISCPGNITISNQTGLCNAFLVAPAPTTNNGCYGTLNLTYALTGATTGTGSNIPATTFNLGTTTVTYTVTDANNSTATASCSFTVTIEDNEDPLISCPADITVSSAAGACTAAVTVPLPVVSDNCTLGASPITWSLSGATTGTGTGAASGTYNAGITVVTYTVTDAAGNTAICEMTVTVLENIKPTITCPGNLTRTTDIDGTVNCTYTATSAEISPILGDNCTPVAGLLLSYTLSGATSGLGTGPATVNFNVGTTFVTYTVEDASGNTRVCSFSVTVTDSTVPTIVCPSNVVGTTDLNACNSLETIPLPTVNDNCGIASVTNSYNNTPNASGVYPLGVTTVTYTVTDTHGNTATCSFTVTITDAQVPSIICPANVAAVTGPGATTCSTILTVAPPVALDNCTAIPTIQYTLSGATTSALTAGSPTNVVFNVGTTTVTYRATDNASNTSTCAISVVVTDNTPPVMACQAAPYTANAATGLCSATVNVPAPPTNDNCTAAAGIAFTWVRSGATTGSGSGTGPATNANGNYNVGTTVVTWTATDQYGNTSSCSVTVIVSDTESPVLVCPTTSPVNAASCSAFVTVPPLSVSDNCSTGTGLSVSFVIRNTNLLGNNNTLVRSGLGTDASGIFPIGVSTITFNVSDAYGNTASCSSTVTVNDVIAPTIVCPANDFIVMTSSADGTGTACATQVNIAPVVAYDNCNNITFTYQAIHTGTSSNNNGVQTDITSTLTGAGMGANASGVYPVGVTVVTYTATDAYGNSSSCIIRIQINDDELPAITLCPPNVTVNNTPGSCANSNVTLATLTATDACGIATITNNWNAGGANASGSYPVGSTTVVFTVTDVNGNTATCSTQVLVIDNEAPVAVCQPLSLSINSGTNITVHPIDVFSSASSDNCGGVIPTSVTPNTFSCPTNNGVNTVVLTVTDTHGNTATCSTTVTIDCCNAEAGTVAVGTICPGQPIPLTAQGFSTDSGTNDYEHYYLIANPTTNVIVANGVIVAGTSASVPYANLTPNTNYVVYGYVVKVGTPSTGAVAPTVGFDIDNIGTLAACWDITGAVSFYVPATPPQFMGYSSIAQGYQGGISPYAYNTETLTFYGGTLPYQFTWNNNGYVRYDIAYQNIDHDNNPATPSLPGAVITVIYSDNATWAVTATDANACSTATLSFNNIPGGVNPNTLLDIDNYAITAQSGTTSNGAIDITVTGGNCGGAYTYQWSGPNGFTATTQDISGLAYGWYSVTVTCGSETTQGWYWVPRQRRGRTKVDGMDSFISIAPNPFNHESSVEFYSEKGGHMTMNVYAMDGREVAKLFDDETEADMSYSVSFNGSNLPSGAYNVVLTDSEGNRYVERAILTK